ncbi:MAG: transcriptional regulator [Edaphobacter sp.]
MDNDRVHVELWTSFASLIRSYGAAHGLNSRHQAVVEVGGDLILLRVGTRWLRFTHSEMVEDNNRSAPFRLNEDGTVTVNGVIEEMDLAAERLAREMMQSE